MTHVTNTVPSGVPSGPVHGKSNGVKYTHQHKAKTCPPRNP